MPFLFIEMLLLVLASHILVVAWLSHRRCDLHVIVTYT